MKNQSARMGKVCAMTLGILWLLALPVTGAANAMYDALSSVEIALNRVFLPDGDEVPTEDWSVTVSTVDGVESEVLEEGSGQADVGTTLDPDEVEVEITSTGTDPILRLFAEGSGSTGQDPGFAASLAVLGGLIEMQNENALSTVIFEFTYGFELNAEWMIDSALSDLAGALSEASVQDETGAVTDNDTQTLLEFLLFGGSESGDIAQPFKLEGTFRRELAANGTDTIFVFSEILRLAQTIPVPLPQTLALLGPGLLLLVGRTRRWTVASSR